MNNTQLIVTVEDLNEAVVRQSKPDRQTCFDCILAVSAQRQIHPKASVGLSLIIGENRQVLGMFEPRGGAGTLIKLFDHGYYDDLKALLPMTLNLLPDDGETG